LEIATQDPIAFAFCHPTILHRFNVGAFPPFCAHFASLTYNIFDQLQLLNNGLPKSAIKMAKTTTLKEFESVFPKLVEDLLAHAKTYNLPDEFVNWYKAVSIIPSISRY
jgi:hypothetical protein